MPSRIPTVDVEVVADYPALKMIWQYHVERADLRPAFYKITSALQQSEEQLYIIVDLSQNPQLPVAPTMMEALRGPFRHPKLAEWLVFGTNNSARWIAELLTKTTKRNNIRWFDTEAEIMNYLDTVATQ